MSDRILCGLLKWENSKVEIFMVTNQGHWFHPNLALSFGRNHDVGSNREKGPIYFHYAA